ncbi:MAG: BTAD domain-containing putative transcriptional regulator [Stackebrandtia sp.]
MRVRILGTVEVRDSTGWRAAGPAKRSVVLASLAMSPGATVSVAELVENLWGTRPPAAAVSTVYGHIARLRKLLGGPEAISRSATGGYRLEVPDTEVDLHRARQLAQLAREAGDGAAAVEHWRQCHALWRDTPLSGIGGGWAETTRETVTTELLGLSAERFEAELDHGHHLAVIGELQDLLARYPLSETLTAHLMTALYRGDRAAEALSRFAALRERMSRELGSEPAQVVRELQRRILNQDAGLRSGESTQDTESAPVSQLPPAPSGFIGRDQEVVAIVSRASRHRLIVVDGMAGVGKTALVSQVAQRLAPRFPDGQLFCDLRGFSGSVPRLEPGDTLNRLLRGMGVDGHDIPVDVEERAALWRRTAAGRRVLIVLDNAATAEQVRPVLLDDDAALVLVSSRRRLPDLDEASPFTVEVLADAAAVQLFQRIAGIREPEADEASILQIVDVCGRLPLAIRLAASRLKNRPQWTPADLAWRLSRHESALPELDFGDRGVTTTFESSYQDVPADQRRLFRLLSLFPGARFGSVAAARLLDVEEPDAEELLERLVDSHLLLTPEPGRYEFHDLLRRFAVRVAERDEPEAERGAARERLIATFCVNTLAAGFTIGPTYLAPHAHLRPRISDIADTGSANAWCEAELANILALIDAVIGTDVAVAMNLARGISPHLYYCARFAELVALARRCAATAEAVADPDAEAEWLVREAVGLSISTNREVTPLFLRALELRRHTGDRVAEAAVLNSLAVHYMRSNEYQKSAQYFADAVSTAEACGSKRLEGLARVNLVPLYVFKEGSIDIPWLKGHLAIGQRIFEDLGDERELVRAWFHLGSVQRRCGELDSAVELHQRVLDYGRASEEPEGEAWANIELARDHIAAKRFTEAEECCEAAFVSISAIDNRGRMRNQVLVELAAAAVGRGHYRAAVEALTEVVTSEAAVIDRFPARSAHRMLARVFEIVGPPEDAQRHRREAERIDADLDW